MSLRDARAGVAPEIAREARGPADYSPGSYLSSSLGHHPVGISIARQY
jgi:hypothetical protein